MDSNASHRRWRKRVEAANWEAITAEVNAFGCGLIGPLLDDRECAEMAALYADDTRFRATINMAQHRFGEGQYRYFAEPFPSAVVALKDALYPRLLPIARDWWTKLGRATPWPDTADTHSVEVRLGRLERPAPRPVR